MKELLFDVPVSLSPFLAWKKKYHVKTYFWKDAPEGEEPWSAMPPFEDVDTANPDDIGIGATEEESCFDMAKSNRIDWFQKVEKK